MTKNGQVEMNANIFQVFHDESERQRLDHGFSELDNSASLKPEWREYSAIRDFFLNRSVDENELYGFLSPDFADKTGLTAQGVREFISSNPDGEVYTFSPSLQDSACYLNVFEQGNRLYPGLVEAAEIYLQAVGLDVDLRTLSMDSRSTVHFNYFVARPSFWRTWFALTEKLYDLFEGDDATFRAQFRARVPNRPQVAMQVLLLERIASLVLTLCPDIKVCAYDANLMPSSNPAYRTYDDQLVFLNDLKVQYQSAPEKSRLDSFYALRGAVLQVCEGKRLARAKDGFLETPLRASHDMLYVCFTHVAKPVEYPSYVSTFSLGGAQGPGKTNLRDLAPEWEPYHPQLGGVAGSFALKNYIVENQIQARHVGICQYRKFVTATRIDATPGKAIQVGDSWDCHALDDVPLAELMAPGERDFLLVRPALLEGGCLNQYNKFHLVQDFLRFAAEAVELGVLQPVDVPKFVNGEVFIVGGIELGVFPMDFWVRTMTSIESVVRACFARFPGKRPGYQARAWAFCAERLGSYLLLKHLTATYDAKVWEQKFIGQLNLVTGDRRTMHVA